MKVSIVDVSLSEDSINEVINTLKSGFLVQGKKTELFEKNFADYIGVKHAIAVNSGTAALDLALKSLNIKDGEVITTPFSFIASSNSILYNNLKPVFADIDERTYNMHPDSVNELVNNKTRAILPVHLYGNPCDMKSLDDIVTDNGLRMVEDAAQAHGAEFMNKKVGSFGDLGCFSFYATKNMTTGEGGMITSNDGELARRLRIMRDQGQSAKYVHPILGYNYRMTDIAASIGIHQLKKLDDVTNKRIKNASYYTKFLKTVITPHVEQEAKHVYHQYVIRTQDEEERDELIKRLNENSVGCAIHYPTTIHRQELYMKLGYGDILLPVAEILSARVLSIPVHQKLTVQELAYVCKVINDEV